MRAGANAGGRAVGEGQLVVVNRLAIKLMVLHQVNTIDAFAQFFSSIL